MPPRVKRPETEEEITEETDSTEAPKKPAPTKKAPVELDVEEVEEVADEVEQDDSIPLTLEEADPNAELWDGGPTVADAVAFKAEYGDIYVTTVTYDKYVLWKTLNRGEYRRVISTLEDMTNAGEASPAELSLYQEELICELCMLSPKMSVGDFEGGLAGLPSLLSQQILESSGFNALDTRGL